MAVVRLGATCDVDEGNTYGRQASFAISEFAVLSDGRRITLHNGRGFSSWSSSGEPWRQMSAAGIERDVLNTVLPDDAEETDEDHPWDWLVELLRLQGVETSPDALKTVPYQVVLSARLLARLEAGGRPEFSVEL